MKNSVPEWLSSLQYISVPEWLSSLQYKNGSLDCNTLACQNGVCATSAGQGDQYYIGNCPLRHTVNNTNRVHSEMPSDPGLLDDVMCAPYNRKGLLCGTYSRHA